MNLDKKYLCTDCAKLFRENGFTIDGEEKAGRTAKCTYCRKMRPAAAALVADDDKNGR